MTFEEWYRKFIVRDQPWGKDGDYRQAPMYLAYKRVWEDAQEEARKEYARLRGYPF